MPLALLCASFATSCGEDGPEGNTRIVFQAPFTSDGFCVSVYDGLQFDPPSDDGSLSLDDEVSTGFTQFGTDCSPEFSNVLDPPVEAGTSHELFWLLPTVELLIEITVLGDGSSCMGSGIRPATDDVALVVIDFDCDE